MESSDAGLKIRRASEEAPKVVDFFFLCLTFSDRNYFASSGALVVSLQYATNPIPYRLAVFTGGGAPISDNLSEKNLSENCLSDTAIPRVEPAAPANQRDATAHHIRPTSREKKRVLGKRIARIPLKL